MSGRFISLSVVFACVFALLAHGHADGQDAWVEGTDITRYCGPRCGSVVLSALGLKAPAFDVLSAECKVDAKGHCSLADIANALTNRGVSVYLTPLEQTPPLAVTIARTIASDYNDGIGHFVVIERIDAARVSVYSPPEAVRVVRWSTFLQTLDPTALHCSLPGLPWGRWIVIALVLVLIGRLVVGGLSRDRAKATTALVLTFLVSACGDHGDVPHPDRLVVAPSDFINLGEVEAGYKDVKLRLVNPGNEPLRLRGYKASCACAEVNGDFDSLLQPGEERPAVVRIRVPEKRQQVIALSFILGDPAELTHVRIKVIGTPPSGVIRENRVAMDPIVLGGVGQTELALFAPFSARTLQSTPGKLGETKWMIETAGPVELGKSRVERRPEGWEVASKLSVRGDVTGEYFAVVHCQIGGAVFRYRVDWTVVQSVLVDPEIGILGRGSSPNEIVFDVSTGEGVVLANPTVEGVGLTATIEGTKGRETRVRVVAADRQSSGRVLIKAKAADGTDIIQPIQVLWDPAATSKER